MPRKNIITVLTQEHKEVARMLAALSKESSRGATRDSTFAELEKALTAHAEFEEARVYAQLHDGEEAQPIALEAEEEHLQVKRLLAEMAQLDSDDPQWEAKLKVLTENISHHVEEEQGELFPQLKEAVGKEELFALAEEYEQVKSGKMALQAPQAMAKGAKGAKAALAAEDDDEAEDDEEDVDDEDMVMAHDESAGEKG
jgi:hemerythrin-like domain-containing protein